MKPRVLTIGLPPDELETVAPVLRRCEIISGQMDLKAVVHSTVQANIAGGGASPDMILVGTPPPGVQLAEVGQTLRMRFEKPEIFAITRDRKNYYRKLAIKNGFTDAFLYPLEAASIKRALQLSLRRLSGGAIMAYRPVRVLDLKVGLSLPVSLSVFLPLNGKYVPFLTAGEILTQDHYSRLTSHKVDTAYVNMDELPEFYHYAGRRSLTERRHELEDRFRLGMSSLFRGDQVPVLEESKSFVSECEKAVHECILDFPADELIRQVYASMGDAADHYSHALNVATYAALFSKILGKANAVMMALAGLWHDIGIIELPEDVVQNRIEPAYREHVTKSTDLMHELRIPVNPSVSMAVMQHHERWDGGGYPTGLMGDLISQEAQLLILADQFDYCTRQEKGQPQRTPQEMVNQFKIKMVDSASEATPPPVPPEAAIELLRAIQDTSNQI